MALTNQELFLLQTHIGTRLMQMDELLLAAIKEQYRIGKMLADKLPDLAPEERLEMRALYSHLETHLEHLEASAKAFRETFEELVRKNSTNL